MLLSNSEVAPSKEQMQELENGNINLIKPLIPTKRRLTLEKMCRILDEKLRSIFVFILCERELLERAFMTLANHRFSSKKELVDLCLNMVMLYELAQIHG